MSSAAGADMEAGTVSLAGMKKEELPPVMQTMTPAERAAYVTKQQVKCADFIAKEQKRLAGTGDSFDAKVAEIIAAEAARMK